MTEYRCYTLDCGFQTNDQRQYESHCIIEHKGKPCYPGTADLEYYNWEPQDMWWEKPVDRSEDVQNYVDKGK